jgi:hypothetical protein
MPQKQIISKFVEELDIFAMNEAKKTLIRKNFWACSKKKNEAKLCNNNFMAQNRKNCLLVFLPAFKLREPGII